MRHLYFLPPTNKKWKKNPLSSLTQTSKRKVHQKLKYLWTIRSSAQRGLIYWSKIIEQLFIVCPYSMVRSFLACLVVEDQCWAKSMIHLSYPYLRGKVINEGILTTNPLRQMHLLRINKNIQRPKFFLFVFPLIIWLQTLVCRH